MKREFYLPMLFLMLISYIAPAQPDRNLRKKCGENCFITEVLTAELTEKGCINYVLKISYTDRCTPALSHYSISMSCGKIYNVTNSEGWKQEYGYDKTTGLYGVKIDDIPNFGETTLKSFTVSFTVCQDGNKKCSTKEGCCYPIVAYKAATCVYYDKLDNACPAPSPSTELKASLQMQDITCYGASDGSLMVVVEEGQEPYTYNWSTGATGASVAGLQPGIYEVTVKDGSGEELVLSQIIEEPDQLIVTGVVTNESCGNENGSIELSISGGIGDYTISWSNIDLDTDYLSSLGAGTYDVIVRDEAGCMVQKSFTVTDESQLAITASVTRPSCNQSNGAIDIIVNGGTEPYTYLWSTGAATQDIGDLRPGNYKVIISDSNGCSAESTFNVQENNTLKLSSVITQTSCLDDGSGAIDLIVTGGTESYEYSWSNGETTQDLSNLNVGSYTVTVTDANGCTATARYFVSNKTFLVSSQVIQPACEGSNGGSITLNPMGGVDPYTYQWSTGETTASISGLDPGIYTVTVTDATGCSRELVYVISEPTGISASTTISNDYCNAEGAYSIDLVVSGGQGPYTYEWSTGASTEDLTGISSGTYTVKITDANGCTTTQEIIVSGDQSSWSCLINQPEGETLCGSFDNVLSTSVEGADSYSWQVTGSDGQWVITQGVSGSSILYSAGGVNSSAVFTLTIVNDGCTQTCTYEITTCKDQDSPDDEAPGDDDDEVPGDDNDDSDNDDDSDNNDDPDDGDDNDDSPDDNDDDNGGEEPGSGSCEECFESEIVKISDDGRCRSYKVTVSTDGSCRYDLSHWNLAIPCGYAKNYTNSRGWKMEYGKDPTTGIYGLKVDDIQNFGKTADSFTVTFTVCTEENSCKKKLDEWNPVVAYKAGTCVGYDTLSGNSDSTPEDNDDTACKAYPNPFNDKLTFEWTADRDEDVSLDLLDSQGHHVKTLYRGKVYRGENYKVDCADLSGSLYIYRFTKRGKTKYGKLCKAR